MGVTLTGYLRCTDARQAARVENALQMHIDLTRAEPGCISFDVTPTDDPLVWRVEEAFVDAPAFAAHQTRAQSSDWARETAGIARDYKIKGLE